MDIIPVIDLMQGQVVRALQGERQYYRPIESGLCPGTSTPLDVVSALLELYPFKTLYIADLDAIGGGHPHLDTVIEIRHRYPELTLWLDAGCRDTFELDRWPDQAVQHVIGSENLSSVIPFHDMRRHLGTSEPILSLDFSSQGPLGPQELFQSPSSWPDTVIAMTLARVGSGSGPDWETLESLRKLAPNRRLIAAGGVRGIEDLSALTSRHIAGALIASALHDGQISRSDIERLGAEHSVYGVAQ